MITPQQQATLDIMVEQIKARATAATDQIFKGEMELYAELLPAFVRWQIAKADDPNIDGEQLFNAAIHGLADIGAHLIRNMSGDDRSTMNAMGPMATVTFSQHLQVQCYYSETGMKMPKAGEFNG